VIKVVTKIFVSLEKVKNMIAAMVILVISIILLTSDDD
jgi:hypothetical protein